MCRAGREACSADETFASSFLSSVQTILDRIHKSIEEKINQLNFVHRNGFNLSYSIKVKRSTMGLPSPHLDQCVLPPSPPLPLSL